MWAAKRFNCDRVLFWDPYSQQVRSFSGNNDLNALMVGFECTLGFDLLYSTVSGKVWAYMRVLGFSYCEFTPFLARGLAIEAASALPKAEGHMQGTYNVTRLLSEWRDAVLEDCWSVERYEDAKGWLGEMLQWHYDRGHPEVRRGMDAQFGVERIIIDTTDVDLADEDEPPTRADVKHE